MSHVRGPTTAWHVLILARMQLAQTTTTAPSSSSNPPFFPSSSSSLAPGASPNPNGNNNNNNGSGGLNTYYAVGLALLLLCVALALFFMFRRRALEMGRRRQNGGRGSALQRDLGGAVIAGDPARGRGYLIGLPRLREPSREEGLDERGEAPPQYISKQEWEQIHTNGEASGPGIPLQTLSRDAAGLKPPDYSEGNTQEADRNGRGSTASGSSSSRPAERGANP